MIAMRNPAFRLAPEWGERIGGYIDTGEKVVRHDRGGKVQTRRRPGATCIRCGARRREHETRRKNRLVTGRPFICGDCQQSDPEYVTMVTTNPKEDRMSRKALAMEQLLQQVENLPDMKGKTVEPEFGEPDGFDVIREVRFSREVTKVLWPLLEPNLDGRVASAIVNRGVLTLTFQPTSPLADDPSPFNLPAVPEEIGEGEDGEGENGPGEVPEP